VALVAGPAAGKRQQIVVNSLVPGGMGMVVVAPVYGLVVLFWVGLARVHCWCAVVMMAFRG